LEVSVIKVTAATNKPLYNSAAARTQPYFIIFLLTETLVVDQEFKSKEKAL
jgi:hypothetical protein